MSTPSMSAQLRLLIQQQGLLRMPCVYDGLTARLAQEAGFPALSTSGSAIAASLLGMPDVGLLGLSENVQQATRLVNVLNVPLICDADTGYGGLLNVMHTVRGYEAAGACAIQIEDQEFPKKCGHMLGRRVISADLMADKIRVAVETRSDPNLLIIARTDARTTLGLDEALRRAEAYAKAGADILFVESPETEEEMRRIGQSFDLPLVANMVEKGRTPVLTRPELETLGYKIAIFPVTALLAGVQAMTQVYQQFKDTGSSAKGSTSLYDFADLTKLMGFEDVWAFEKRYAETD